ncbi:MAG: hypothetical protein NC407_02615, partial [Lachnoclostridium sp.]|nr:hypothetical protein [Lachnoclostridium sp.]
KRRNAAFKLSTAAFFTERKRAFVGFMSVLPPTNESEHRLKSDFQFPNIRLYFRISWISCIQGMVKNDFLCYTSHVYA